MLNADDQNTFLAIRELTKLMEESQKPLIFWIGAGASKWLDYPLWNELALDLRRQFFKYVPGFDNDLALRLIRENSFPQFFQQCRSLDQPRYFKLLSDAFLPRSETAIYKRFVSYLTALAPLHILTTNVDEALEQRITNTAIFQRSDLSGCIPQLQAGMPFIAKLHGSRSAIENTVFTQGDYERLKGDNSYINVLKTLFHAGTIVFLGYSLRDQYVIDLLSDNARDMSLFGAGPHFVVSSAFQGTTTLRQINYSLKRFADHRSALTVLDLIRQIEARKIELRSRIQTLPNDSLSGISQVNNQTAYFISDILLPGTQQTSITAQLEANDGIKREATFGLGFTSEELPVSVSTAFHDVVVGLMCFDVVYFSLAAVGSIHLLLGPELFWRCVKDDAIRFIHLQHQPVVISSPDALIGDIGLAAISDSTGTPQNSGVFIRRQIGAAEGRKDVAEALISELETKVKLFADSDNINMAALVRAAVMMPGVARLLGVGEAILPTQVPKWLAFPYLRMAHLVQTGAVCDSLGIQAAKIPFGGERLASAAFGVQTGSDLADSYASYVLSGRFDTDIGATLSGQPSIFVQILHFRSTAEGEAFRREIQDQLQTNSASEFTASVNAGLKRNVPLKVLQRAKDQLSSLLTEKSNISPVPAVWTNALLSDNATRLWRAKSRATLLQMARDRRLRGDDPCVCGSGDRLRLCCLLPLRD